MLLRFFPLSNYNTALLWCFQEFFLGPPRIPKSRDKVFSCNLCVHCWMHVASSQHLTWCGCCRAAAELYYLGEDEKTDPGMFGPVTVWFLCVFTTQSWLDLQIWNWQMGTLATVIWKLGAKIYRNTYCIFIEYAFLQIPTTFTPPPGAVRTSLIKCGC